MNHLLFFPNPSHSSPLTVVPAAAVVVNEMDDIGGLVAPSSDSAAAAAATSFFFLPPETESNVPHKGGIFSFIKDEHEWRRLKMARTAAASAREQMLSFSKQQDALSSISTDPISSSYSSSPFCGGAEAGFVGGGGSSSMGGAGVHGVLAGVRGLFTPNQWMELEHQALIYKYIDSNSPIPRNLLLPQPSLPHFLDAGSARSSTATTTLGWGPYVGFSESTDPELGRCRRTDGKKWRCSRDAVADGKYCERHMNRGRHRSRKHVEGQNGHTVKAMPAPSSAAMVIPGTEPANNLLSSAQQTKNSKPIAAGPPSLRFNRITMSKDGANDGVLDTQVLSALSSANSNASPNTLFSNLKQHNPFDGLSLRAEIGHPRTDDDSFLARSTKPYSENISLGSPSELNDQHSQTQQPLLPFFDDWPKGERSERLDTQLGRTQLSISIPMASSDFSSSSSSPIHENPTLSPLKLYREFNVGLLNEAANHQGQASWVPVPWETSLGGPLGEVLTNTNNISRDSGGKPCPLSSLNLLTDGWHSSPRLGSSSPTGVLQNTTCVSLSSSTGSSPRAENQKPNILSWESLDHPFDVKMSDHHKAG